jgi:DNA-binding IscR family transcriptional regulator
MLKINKNVKLALQTIEFLQGSEKPVRTQDIAAKIGTSTAFLEQIVRRLRVAGITKSVRGPGGGTLLSRGQTVTALGVAKAFGYSGQSELSGVSETLSGALTKAFESIRIEL